MWALKDNTTNKFFFKKFLEKFLSTISTHRLLQLNLSAIGSDSETCGDCSLTTRSRIISTSSFEFKITITRNYVVV
jgi:hypothetical protein